MDPHGNDDCPYKTGWNEFDAAYRLISAMAQKFQKYVHPGKPFAYEMKFDWDGMLSEAYATSERIYIGLAYDLWRGDWDEENIKRFGVPSIRSALGTLSTLKPLHDTIGLYRPSPEWLDAVAPVLGVREVA